MTSPRIDGWSVTVNVNGEDVLYIGHNSLSGIPDIDKYADIVSGAAMHLQSFIGGRTQPDMYEALQKIADYETRGPVAAAQLIAIARAALSAASPKGE